MTDEVRVVTIVEGRPVVTALGVVQQVGVTGPDVTLSANGIVVRTGFSAYVARTLVSVAAALTIANPDGVAAAPTFDLSAELKAVAAVGTTGYVKRTGVATWTTSASVPYTDLSGVPATFAPSAHSHPWSDITGTPTTATGYGIASIDNVPIGATTANTGRFTSLVTTTGGLTSNGTGNSSFAGPLGIGIAPGASLQISNAITGGTTDVIAVRLEGVLGSGLGANNYWGYRARLTTSGSTTVFNAQLFNAETITIGGTATVTNVFGFRAGNGIALGTANYGFYSDINDATTTYQFFGFGSATSVLNGPLNFLTVTTGKDVLLRIGASGSNHPSTAATTYGAYLDLTVASTSATQWTGYNTILRTAAAAFTVANLHHYRAQTTSLGAGSAATSVYGFVAENTIAVGGSNYGFYSNINTAATTWQFYGSGTAQSYFGGPVGIQDTNPISTFNVFRVGGSHPSTNTTIYGMTVDITAPATATAALSVYRGVGRTNASVFTLPALNLFFADTAVKGAGSSVTALRGFYANSGLAGVATNTYGFYSDINSATTTWQLYMAGTAQNYFGGPVGVLLADPLGNASILSLGGGSAHPSTAATVVGTKLDFLAPSTSITTVYGQQMVLRTAAAAVTYASIRFYTAEQLVQGATSVISNIYGFMARNAIVLSAIGTTSYGFYSDLNVAASGSQYQLFMAGTAFSYFGGELGIRKTPQNDRALYIAEPTSTGTVRIGVHSQIIGASTTTGFLEAYCSDLTTSAAVYTTGNAFHYLANSTTLNAGSIVTNVMGFYAASAIAVGTNNYGFYSTINFASNTYQLYMAGTAPSLFGGAVIEKEITVTYSASMTIDASTGNEQIITATNATAFAINVPTNPATGQYLEVTIRNTSGGALGVASWNAVFKMTAWAQPATAFSRTIIFRYNGTNWVEKGRTAVDVPN